MLSYAEKNQAFFIEIFAYIAMFCCSKEVGMLQIMLFIQLVSNRLKSSGVSSDNLCGQKPCCTGDIDGAGGRGSECVSEDC